jgi:hypothetical protein
MKRAGDSIRLYAPAHPAVWKTGSDDRYVWFKIISRYSVGK